MTTFSSHLRELMKGATPEPWAANRGTVSRDSASKSERSTVSRSSPADAALIVALSNAAPQLMALVEAVEQMGWKDPEGDRVTVLRKDWERIQDALSALNSEDNEKPPSQS